LDSDRSLREQVAWDSPAVNIHETFVVRDKADESFISLPRMISNVTIFPGVE